MDRIKGLQDLIESPKYRQALGLPMIVSEKYELLAQGEYNINYHFIHPISEQHLLLRVNCGSQMHLEHQIEYEAQALKLLERSGRTPRVLYVDGSKEYLDHGILVMEYLEGKELDYRTQMECAAECLADIHSVKLTREEKSYLIEPEEPLRAILKECEEMLAVYLEAGVADEKKKIRLRNLLDAGWKMVRELNTEKEQWYKCCINTELNSTNFLIQGLGKQNYLIDWEKPLYGEPAQDLGHFLAPTTTFWKTDVILTEAERDAFVDDYIRAVDERFDTTGFRQRVKTFTTITCLRGITWCAMAWVDYQNPNKLIVNKSTKRKLDAYLGDNFLMRIEKIFEGYLLK